MIDKIKGSLSPITVVTGISITFLSGITGFAAANFLKEPPAESAIYAEGNSASIESSQKEIERLKKELNGKEKSDKKNYQSIGKENEYPLPKNKRNFLPSLRSSKRKKIKDKTSKIIINVIDNCSLENKSFNPSNVSEVCSTSVTPKKDLFLKKENFAFILSDFGSIINNGEPSINTSVTAVDGNLRIVALMKECDEVKKEAIRVSSALRLALNELSKTTTNETNLRSQIEDLNSTVSNLQMITTRFNDNFLSDTGTINNDQTLDVVSRLMDERNVINEQLNGAKTEIDCLKSQINVFKNENKNLCEILNASEKNLTLIQNENNELKKQVANKNEEIKRLEVQILELRFKKEELESVFITEQERFQNIAKERDAILIDYERILKERDDLRGKNYELEREKINTQNKAEKLRNELENERQNYSKMMIDTEENSMLVNAEFSKKDEENQCLKNKLVDNNIKIRNLEQENVNLQKKFKELHKKFEETTKARDMLKKELGNLKTESGKLTIKIKGIEQNNYVLADEISNSRSESENLRKILNTSEENLKQIQNENDELKRQIFDQKEHIDELRNKEISLKETIDKSQDEILTLFCKISELQEELQEKIQNTSFIKEIFANKLNTLRKDVGLKEDVSNNFDPDVCDQKTDELRERLKKLKEDKQELIEEKNDTVEQYGNFYDMVSDALGLRRNVGQNELIARAERSKKDFETLQYVNNKLQEVINIKARIDRDVQRLTSELMRSLADRENLESQYEELRNSFDDTREEFEGFLNQLKDVLKITGCQPDYDEILRSIKASKNKFKAFYNVIRNLKQEKNVLRTTISKLMESESDVSIDIFIKEIKK